jgi:hypothetical protein
MVENDEALRELFSPNWHVKTEFYLAQYRIVHEINDALENKRFCTAAFIGISQAFDKFWHTGLFYKLKTGPPAPDVHSLSILSHEKNT